MKIIYEPGFERIQVKQQEIEQLLRDEWVCETDIADLCLHIQRERDPRRQEIMRQHYKEQGEEEGTVLGEWKKGHVYLYIYDGRDSAALNKTLLHELHHEIKDGYAPGEHRLPHPKRPSEIAAYRFADEQSEQHKLIKIPGELLYTLLTGKNSIFVALDVVAFCLFIFVAIQLFQK
jgi:hypothetical protein